MLRLADEFDASLASARQAVRNRPKDAVKQPTALLDTIAANDFLEHNKPQVLDTLGQAYLASGQPNDAVKVFEQRLAMEAETCKPQATYPSGCAGVQMDLATAKTANGEARAGVVLMRLSCIHIRGASCELAIRRTATTGISEETGNGAPIRLVSFDCWVSLVDELSPPRSIPACHLGTERRPFSNIPHLSSNWQSTLKYMAWNPTTAVRIGARHKL